MRSQNIAVDFYEQNLCLWAAWLITCDFFWKFGVFVCLMWKKLIPGAFKAASYAGQVFLDFGFDFFFLIWKIFLTPLLQRFFFPL